MCNRFIEELEEGIFIQQSLETVFMDTEGKQVHSLYSPHLNYN